MVSNMYADAEQKAMKKVQNELDAVVEAEGMPTKPKKLSLPPTEQVLPEILANSVKFANWMVEVAVEKKQHFVSVENENKAFQKRLQIQLSFPEDAFSISASPEETEFFSSKERKLLCRSAHVQLVVGNREYFQKTLEEALYSGIKLSSKRISHLDVSKSSPRIQKKRAIVKGAEKQSDCLGNAKKTDNSARIRYHCEWDVWDVNPHYRINFFRLLLLEFSGTPFRWLRKKFSGTPSSLLLGMSIPIA